MNFNFWQKWLLFVGVYLVVFGLFLAFFPQSSVLNLVINNNIDHYFWQPMPESALKFQEWIYGVLGSVIAGWGLLIAFWANYPFKTLEKWAWNGAALSFTLWYLVDTAISYNCGVIFNVGFNTVMFLLLIIPVIFSRKYFYK